MLAKSSAMGKISSARAGPGPGDLVLTRWGEMPGTLDVA